MSAAGTCRSRRSSPNVEARELIDLVLARVKAFKLTRDKMDDRLLDILACPVCKGPLKFQRAAEVLVCRAERLAFPIRDGVPMMLEEDARQLPSDDPLLDDAE